MTAHVRIEAPDRRLGGTADRAAMSRVTIRVDIDAAPAVVRNLLVRTSTHNAMSEVEDALWLLLNPLRDDGTRDLPNEVDVTVTDWTVAERLEP